MGQQKTIDARPKGKVRVRVLRDNVKGNVKVVELEDEVYPTLDD